MRSAFPINNKNSTSLVYLFAGLLAAGAFAAGALAAGLFAALAAGAFEAGAFAAGAFVAGAVFAGEATTAGVEAFAGLAFALFAGALLAAPPQAMPSALNPRTDVNMIFFILFKTPNLTQIKFVNTCFQVQADRDTAVLALSSFFLKANDNIRMDFGLVN